jgi:hypothetical protein
MFFIPQHKLKVETENYMDPSKHKNHPSARDLANYKNVFMKFH